jgi:Pirin
MHERRNDEIITYITDGLVRHADSSGARLIASPTKIMVMNAGKGFWHETPDDPTLRALQISGQRQAWPDQQMVAIAASLACPMHFKFWTQICLPTQFTLDRRLGARSLSVLGY